MKTKRLHVTYGFLILAFLPASCMGLPAVNDGKESIDIPLGPQLTEQEHQTQVFETLWSRLEENYIYYESAAVDWNGLQEKYVDRIESGLSPEEFNSLLNELETDLPENEIVFQSRTERIEGDIANTSTYGGIGAFVGFQKDAVPHVVILDVMPGSPAEKAGLQAHDSILAVDGDPVRLEEGLNVVERIRGPAGTTALLTVQTPGESERKIKITRAQLTGIGELKSERFADTNIGYVLFPPSASADMTDELLLALTNFSTNNTLNGLILDLRISNSTSGWPLEAMLALFEDGRVGEVYDRGGSQTLSLNGQDLFGSQDIPLVILVGENTRGLPEVFAAAMQANGRATVVGSNTSGNIETLAGYLLPDGSQVFIASTSFRLSNGEEVGINGIRPEVRVEAKWDEIISNDDPLIQAAIEALKVEP